VKEIPSKGRPMCSANGCENPPIVRGLCNRHYQAWYREHRADQKRDSDRRWRARVDYNARRRKPKERRTCAAPDCDETFEAANNKRFCSKSCKKRAENRKRRARLRTSQELA
jgi:hypothetical protein